MSQISQFLKEKMAKDQFNLELQYIILNSNCSENPNISMFVGMLLGQLDAVTGLNVSYNLHDLIHNLGWQNVGHGDNTNVFELNNFINNYFFDDCYFSFSRNDTGYLVEDNYCLPEFIVEGCENGFKTPVILMDIATFNSKVEHYLDGDLSILESQKLLNEIKVTDALLVEKLETLGVKANGM